MESHVSQDGLEPPPPWSSPTSIFLLDYIFIKKKKIGFKLPTTYLESSEPYL